MIKENANQDQIGPDLMNALRERGEILYYANMKEKFSKRKNADGTCTYQVFLEKLDAKKENPPIRHINSQNAER